MFKYSVLWLTVVGNMLEHYGPVAVISVYFQIMMTGDLDVFSGQKNARIPGGLNGGLPTMLRMSADT